MTEKTAPNNGGPARPTPDFHHPNGEIEVGSNGMSIRTEMAKDFLAQFVHPRASEEEIGIDITKACAYADELIERLLKDGGVL